MLYCESEIRESRAGKPIESESSSVKDSRSDEIVRGSATESACTRASAERDAEHRSGSEYPDE